MAEGKGAVGDTSVSSNNVKAAALTVPLDSVQRTQPIHPLLPEIKLFTKYVVPNHDTVADNNDVTGLPTQAFHPVTLNPLTLQPFTIEDLHSHNLESLLRQFPTQEAAKKALDDTAKELRKLIDDNDRKTKEIEREMDEKEKTRQIERRVYAKKLGKDG